MSEPRSHSGHWGLSPSLTLTSRAVLDQFSHERRGSDRVGDQVDALPGPGQGHVKKSSLLGEGERRQNRGLKRILGRQGSSGQAEICPKTWLLPVSPRRTRGPCPGPGPALRPCLRSPVHPLQGSPGRLGPGVPPDHLSGLPPALPHGRLGGAPAPLIIRASPTRPLWPEKASPSRPAA